MNIILSAAAFVVIVVALGVLSATAHRSSGWLNDTAHQNMEFMSLTLDTSHLSNGWLNDAAP